MHRSRQIIHPVSHIPFGSALITAFRNVAGIAGVAGLSVCLSLAASAEQSAPVGPASATSIKTMSPGIRSNTPVLRPTLEELRALRSDWANPYLSFLPTEVPRDDAYWRAIMAHQAKQRRRVTPSAKGSVKGLVVFDESEPNSSAATANHIAVFGTDPGETSAIDVQGSFGAVPAPLAIGPFAEDEGSIPLASDTGLTVGSAVTVNGTIGDGPFGSSGDGPFGSRGSGDHDFFRIANVEIGQLIIIDIDTDMPFEALDTFIALYDSDGNSLALNEDGDSAVSLDSFLAIPATVAGDHYVSVGGSLFPFAAILSDPFDSSTGFGVGSEGDYTLHLQLDYGDQDWFSFDLETCDILGINLLDAGRQVQLVGPDGQLIVASSQDLSAIYPPSTSLPGGGRATMAHVVAHAGRYAVRALGADGPDYTMELRLFRQPLENSETPKTIFVDFDGATVDPAIFTGPPGEITLSPLADFLAGWGLSLNDENALIDATLQSLAENLDIDLSQQGPNGAFGVQILNSRDHADPFGDPNVSRLIIGGTVPELGITTIGIAQSIDPGNFETAETGVILLDLLSRPAGDPNSLNTFPLADGASKIDFVGLSLGNIAAHEAGHYVGNYHTEQFNPDASLMDRGGNLPNTLGVGADGIFGNEDDVDVDFTRDRYEVTERFAGLEDTQAVVSCGCTTSAGIFTDGFESGTAERWSSSAP